jgi:hypothetical protein
MRSSRWRARFAQMRRRWSLKKRAELTTEGGLDVIANREVVARAVRRLADAACRCRCLSTPT